MFHFFLKKNPEGAISGFLTQYLFLNQITKKTFYIVFNGTRPQMVSFFFEKKLNFYNHFIINSFPKNHLSIKDIHNHWF
jgi:hypothetical protein